MGMLAIFCTNSINIYAGINGLEVGQSIIIAGSIAIFNYLELSGEYSSQMNFSLHFIIPFLGTSLVLYYFNRYPSRVFVGDTYCYFAGMTFAVVGILGEMSKTILLFFLPQLLNFLISVPQLFKLIPCPRHRMPNYNKETDKLENSLTDKFHPNGMQKALIALAEGFKIITISDISDKHVVVTNFTLINTVLGITGPLHERTLCYLLLLLQILSSCLAFFIRLKLAAWVY